MNPVNLYGATKLCFEKIFVAARSYAGNSPSVFAVVRYGNVVGSRGSVIPIFKRQALGGTLTITDPGMSRFWITLDQAVDFVTASLERMVGGEIFVPKLPSMRVEDIATALAPEAEQEVIGIRPGEKLHEVLITEDEARNCAEFPDHYSIRPAFEFERGPYPEGRSLPGDFRYASGTNDDWLAPGDIAQMAESVQPA